MTDKTKKREPHIVAMRDPGRGRRAGLALTEAKGLWARAGSLLLSVTSKTSFML